jgi:deoxyribonuclease V
VIPTGDLPRLYLVAGADCAFSPDGGECIAAVVVWDVSARQVVEQVVVRRPLRFPYVPGLLTFREAPAILAAIRKLRREPDVFLFDGQGYAHPRRFGLACHLGVLMDRPSLGCAKSILVGNAGTPGVRRGSTAPLVHDGEQIGAAVRTRDGVKPVYVSIGHRLSLDAAVEIVLACGDGFRLPEPTRRADILVGCGRLAY